MDFPTNWKINTYKNEFENDEHWSLRKTFMKKHKKKFPEDQLVCLAQVFLNIEYLGCSYPKETVQLIQELSKDLCIEIKNRRNNRLQRTFVKASEQAKNKLKRTSNFNNDNHNPIKKPKIITSNYKRSPNTDKELTVKDIKNVNALKNFILFDPDNTNSSNILQISSVKLKIHFDFIFVNNSEDDETFCYIYFEDKLLAKGGGKCYKKNGSKPEASNNLIKKLQTFCYTIKTKNIIRNANSISKKCKGDGNSSEYNELNQDNKGYKLMKLLGWSGGGLGANKDGITKPIEVEMNIGRKGLCTTNEQPETLDINYYKKLFTTYQESSQLAEMVFSTEFSNEERAQLHKLAKQYGLRSKSIGKDINRQLIVFKFMSLSEIVHKLLKNDSELTEKYELISPTNTA